MHQPGAALWVANDLDLDLSEPVDFRVWVRALNAQSVPTQDDSTVAATNWWITRGRRYVGSIQLRHSLNDLLADIGGHIGYGVRPSERRNGAASFALRHVLTSAAEDIGLTEVLITCDEFNTGSRKAIEAAGGVLRSVRDADDLSRKHGHVGNTLRYWAPTVG